MRTGSLERLTYKRRLAHRRELTARTAFVAAGSFPLETVALISGLGVTVLGAWTLSRMPLPPVTHGGGATAWLLWGLWCVSLMTCPVAIWVVSFVYRHAGPPLPGWPPPWPVRLAYGLGTAQLGVSVSASLSAVVLARGAYRWIAWAVVLAVGALTCVLIRGAEMVTTGWYL